MSIAASICIDYLRALFVRYMNDHWCWDMEKTFPQVNFKIFSHFIFHFFKTKFLNPQFIVW